MFPSPSFWICCLSARNPGPGEGATFTGVDRWCGMVRSVSPDVLAIFGIPCTKGMCVGFGVEFGMLVGDTWVSSVYPILLICVSLGCFVRVPGVSGVKAVVAFPSPLPRGGEPQLILQLPLASNHYYLAHAPWELAIWFGMLISGCWFLAPPSLLLPPFIF